MVAGPAFRGVRSRTVDRLVGTLLGVAAATALDLLGLSVSVLVGLAILAMVGSVAVTGTSHRWSSLFMTIAVVLVAAPGGAVADTAVRRLGYTIAGATVLTCGAVVARIVLPHMRHPHPDLPSRA